MMQLMRPLVIVVLAATVLPLLAVIIVNSVDEALEPKAESFGVPRASSVPDGVNGYYALIALAAPGGTDGFAYAKAWVAEARAAARENRREKRIDAKHDQRSQICDPVQLSCLATAQEKVDEVWAQIDAHKEEIERYEALIAFPRYEEVLDFPQRLGSQFPSYRAVNLAQRAFLLRAALAAASGSMDAAVAAAERDIAFQRAMLAGARTVLGKMVAAANYWRSLAFVSDLIQRYDVELVPLRERLQAMTQPLETSMLQIAPLIETEFSANRALFRNPVSRQVDGDEARLIERIAVRLAYKPNATINRAYVIFSKAQAQASVPAKQLAATHAMQDAEVELRLWDYIDNPIANILLSIAMPDFRNYALRLHDLDAFSRLIALRAEMLAAGISADGAAEFASKSRARHYNPYTMKPIAWDAARRQLWFKPYAPNASRKQFNTAPGRVYVQL
jgi:hypothetical protein